MAGICEVEGLRCSSGDEPLTLMRCHNYMKPLGENPFVTYNLKGIKGKNSVFFSFISFVSLLQ